MNITFEFIENDDETLDDVYDVYIDGAYVHAFSVQISNGKIVELTVFDEIAETFTHYPLTTLPAAAAKIKEILS